MIWTIIFRTVLFYFLVVIAYKIMGKREVGELGVFDFIISMLISQLIAICIENYKDPIWFVIVPTLILVLFQIVFSFLSLKSNKFRDILDGKESVIISNGKLNFSEMKKQKYLEMHPYSITLGKDGFWHTYLPLGNSKRKAVKKKSKEDIDNVVIDFWKRNTTTTFKQRYSVWVERQKQCGRSNNTISKYESDYIRFFEGDRLENMDIRDIDEVVLSQFIERLLKSKEIPYRALQAMIGYVNGVFKKSVKDGIIKKSDNPCDEVDLPLYKQYCKRETIKTSAERTFSKKEKNSLLDILATNHETKPNYIPSYAVELSLYTGMRVGELSGLMWEDIDTEQNIIHIRHSEKHDRKNNEYYISLPKNGKIRDFPLTPEIEDILNRVKKVELKNNWLTEYVFSNDKGRVHARTISECMRLKTSGTDFHNVKCIHTSRRTVNSEYAKAGMPATARASIIGNTERVNEQNYTYDISEMDYKRSIISMVNRATKAM